MKGRPAESITLTDRSAAFVARMLLNSVTQRPKLRISLKGGGCAGVQYKFSLDDAVSRDDLVFVASGIRLLIDCISYHYVRGSVVDCSTEESKLGLVVHNPNATVTCNCGTSFAV